MDCAKALVEWVEAAAQLQAIQHLRKRTARF